MNNKYKNTLYLAIESNFGSLERVIGSFTLRGLKIDNLFYSVNNETSLYDLKITFECTDQELEKIVKILHNQIHVIEIKLILDDNNSCRTKMPLAS